MTSYTSIFSIEEEQLRNILVIIDKLHYTYGFSILYQLYYKNYSEWLYVVYCTNNLRTVLFAAMLTDLRINTHS